ncbi:MAG TPA: hypothetical protein VJ810_22275 [Blastocatellia bacterium]|nr:hypothetical protein [Blastocatellia bacterium]
MSGMKFRLQCAGCGATFFAPDRKSRRCPKCLKKGVLKKGAVAPKLGSEGPPAGRFDSKPVRAAAKDSPRGEPKPNEGKRPTLPKAAALTPDLSEQIAQIYREQFAGGATPADEIIAQISDRVWLQRKIVSQVIYRLIHPSVTITPELKERIIGMYKGYVERSERPAGGRRRTIAVALSVPLHQVRNIVYEWSQSQYAQSPTPELSRDQLFEIEKEYWNEIERARYRYSELPAKIAEQVGYATAYQVSRWLDMLHDDQCKFDNITDASPEAERQILEAYMQYLASPKPPERGLHGSIASQVDGVNGRQVHKVLQRYRYQRRDKYPWNEPAPEE